MLKMLLFLTGLTAGAGGAAALLLSGPEGDPLSVEPATLSPQTRSDQLKGRVRLALSEGSRSGVQTQEQLLRKLDAYRTQSSQPAHS